MPLTEAQLTGIQKMLNGWTDEQELEHDGLQQLMNAILFARDDVLALLRIHGDLPDAVATTVLAKAKASAKATSEELAALLA